MLDQYNRDIYYLRIAVTDLCNLRCTYCMPKEGIKLKKHEEILSFEDFFEIVKVAIKLGFYKFRLTGGEPLVRRGIIDLVKMLAQINGVKTLAMTTNGLLLPQYAKELKKAGLSRLNISLDSLKPEKYKEITRGGKLEDVLAGIKSSCEAGFEKTKLNAVIVDGFNDDEKDNLKKFAEENKMKIRFIKKMDLKSGDYYGVEGGEGGDCSICNRIRLTADGKLRSCLFSDYEVDVRQVGIEQAFRQVIGNKPAKGEKSLKREMIEIGG
ncbi:radical SAM protein [candidate division WOR-1 bacterium RIFOXYB2_FULL_42_35]|uniref:GTP 3',8-cyclase n=1 Tax=candidate division WOR-1 bacterium RIFOXYC2_FULL_41_25 TaxID=1802586 RepID=A0A1F4TNI3_UNCSA|nr:MAG: radical SAM protein [candidate division WOR-1 bacterium RIFOXYA2_FULL_41_14]OGC24662.1 MAG: radical SAM protein [candidate division WOR-1 bacterium RIFOXYB2_FULL_42_35]OGC34177.1 MAG: radical SAM protein [candidate division WOR-1 bacterium RIFOXYC2_FULL_41_25]OGC42261.1 MAG: radical SAM protein [candidate division WOR-1 bacterium RIFOXYD2_FULL_41_8]